jgi:RNA polymerase sigma-70 factor, ECF subfamily
MQMPAPEHPLDDVELFALLRDGSREAFDALCRRHGGWVRTVIRGVWAQADELDDLCQVCWLRIWQRASRLREPRRWRGWVVSIARSTAIDARRRYRRYQSTHASLELYDVAQGPERSQWLEHEHAIQAVASLKEKYRLPLMLRIVEEWSYARIAEALGLSEAGVESRLYRARKMLRRKLEEGD